MGERSRWGLLLKRSDPGGAWSWQRASSDGALAPIPVGGRPDMEAVVSPRGGHALFVTRAFDPAADWPRGRLRSVVDLRSASRRELDVPFAAFGSPAWSGDEARLAYVVHAPSRYPGEPDFALEVRDLRDNTARRLPSGPIESLRWQPGDRDILAIARDGAGARSASTIRVDDLARSAPAPLPVPPTADAWSLSPDGRSVAYIDESTEDEDGPSLFLLRLDDGRTTRIAGPEWTIRPTWSPLGSTFAFVSLIDRDGDGKGLCLVDAGSGEVRRVATLNPGDVMGDMGVPLAWSPDGSLLAFASFEEDGDSAVSLHDLASGTVSEWLRTDGLIHSLDFIEATA